MADLGPAESRQGVNDWVGGQAPSVRYLRAPCLRHRTQSSSSNSYRQDQTPIHDRITHHISLPTLTSPETPSPFLALALQTNTHPLPRAPPTSAHPDALRASTRQTCATTTQTGPTIVRFPAILQRISRTPEVYRTGRWKAETPPVVTPNARTLVLDGGRVRRAQTSTRPPSSTKTFPLFNLALLYSSGGRLVHQILSPP